MECFPGIHLVAALARTAKCLFPKHLGGLVPVYSLDFPLPAQPPPALVASVTYHPDLTGRQSNLNFPRVGHYSHSPSKTLVYSLIRLQLTGRSSTTVNPLAEMLLV